MKKLTLREQQLVALDILKYFDKICQEHNIQYSLGGGTLLGAVRHKGFIPWDDDIDLYMRRDQYEKFVKVWNQQKHSRYELSPIENIDAFLPGEITKIFDNKTKLYDGGGRPAKIFLDIFLYDGVPNDAKIIYKVMKKYRILKLRFTSCKKRWLRAKENSLQQKLFKKLAHYYFNKMNNYLADFQKQYPLESTEYMGLVISDYEYWKVSYMPQKYFSDVVYLDFEDSKFPCMNAYHEYLSMYYGDYMQLPPKEEQKPKHTLEAYLDE